MTQKDVIREGCNQLSLFEKSKKQAWGKIGVGFDHSEFRRQGLLGSFSSTQLQLRLISYYFFFGGDFGKAKELVSEAMDEYGHYLAHAPRPIGRRGEEDFDEDDGWPGEWGRDFIKTSDKDHGDAVSKILESKRVAEIIKEIGATDLTKVKGIVEKDKKLSKRFFVTLSELGIGKLLDYLKGDGYDGAEYTVIHAISISLAKKVAQPTSPDVLRARNDFLIRMSQKGI